VNFRSSAYEQTSSILLAGLSVGWEIRTWVSERTKVKHIVRQNIVGSSHEMTLSWQHITYKPSKLGHTDLVFCLSSEFISRPVRAGLQVYVQRL